MKRLDAYVRITCEKATRLAEDAIAGVAERRRIRAAREMDEFVRRETRPRRFRRAPTEEDAKARLLQADGRFWDDPGYDYWWVLNCLHAGELRAAKALLDSSRGGGKGRHVLINPEDMAEMRAIGKSRPMATADLP